MKHLQAVWEIPEPISVHEVCVDDDTKITLRRHGNPAGLRLVLSHGNGLAIDLYYPFWSLLTSEFDVIVYDLRNHGWNSVTSQRRHHLPAFVEDHDAILDAIDKQLGDKPKIGIFHSVSALATLLSPDYGQRYRARILYDPPVCKPDQYPLEFDSATRRYAEMTLRRTERFESIAECVDFLRYIPAFNRVVPGVFDLFAKTTLRHSEQGFVLRCPRDYEAQVIYYARAFAILVDFDKFRCPTKVIGADPTLPYSYLPSFDLSHIMGVDYDFLPDSTHLLQLEQPKECVKLMREFLDFHNLLSLN